MTTIITIRNIYYYHRCNIKRITPIIKHLEKHGRG